MLGTGSGETALTWYGMRITAMSSPPTAAPASTRQTGPPVPARRSGARQATASSHADSTCPTITMGTTSMPETAYVPATAPAPTPRTVPPSTHTPPGTARTASPEARNASARPCPITIATCAPVSDCHPDDATKAGLARTRICSARNGPNAAAPSASRQDTPGAVTGPDASSRYSAAAPTPTNARHASQGPRPSRHTGSQVAKHIRTAPSMDRPATVAVAKPTPDRPRAPSYSAATAIMPMAVPANASPVRGSSACARSRTANSPPTPASSSPRGPAKRRISGAVNPAR